MYIYINMYICMCIYVYIPVSMPVHMSMCMHIFRCMHIYKQRWTCVRTCAVTLYCCHHQHICNCFDSLRSMFSSPCTYCPPLPASAHEARVCTFPKTVLITPTQQNKHQAQGPTNQPSTRPNQAQCQTQQPSPRPNSTTKRKALPHAKRLRQCSAIASAMALG